MLIVLEKTRVKNLLIINVSNVIKRDIHNASEYRVQKHEYEQSSKVSLFTTEEKSNVCKITEGSSGDACCLDSGCTSHICKDSNMFTNVN